MLGADIVCSGHLQRETRVGDGDLASYRHEIRRVRTRHQISMKNDWKRAFAFD
jgi:hypothetical protein